MKTMVKGCFAGGAMLMATAAQASWYEDTTNALAQAEHKIELTVITDYVFRGVSQTQEEPAFQALYGYYHDIGLYGEAWMSNIDFGDAADDEIVEMDFTFGYERELYGLTWNVGYIHYDFPREDDFDLNEYFASVSHSGEYGNSEIKYWWDVQTSNRYTEINYSYDFPYDIEAGAHVGNFHETAHDGDDYMDYKFWLGWTYKIVSFELAYHDTDGRNVANGAEFDDEDDRRLVFGVTLSVI